LGLRPLWFGTTEKEYFASSEKGVVPLEAMTDDPRPMAPGEKMGLLLRRGSGVDVFEHQELQQRIYDLALQRYDFRRLNEVTMNASLFAFTAKPEEPTQFKPSPPVWEE